jgi:hypothetical protein
MTLRVLGKVGVICGGKKEKQKQRQTEQNTAKNNKGV